MTTLNFTGAAFLAGAAEAGRRTQTHRPSFTLVDPVTRTFRAVCDCDCRYRGPVVATEAAAIADAEAYAGLTIRQSTQLIRDEQHRRELAAGRRAARGF